LHNSKIWIEDVRRGRNRFLLHKKYFYKIENI